MAVLRVIVLASLLVAASARTLSKSRGIPKFPPKASGNMPKPGKDGAFESQADACAACKFTATKSCAMYQTCICHATNAVFPIVGLPKPTDTKSFHWACGGEGGDMYKQCFTTSEQYVDAFGDEIDPNNKKCDFGGE